MIAPVSPSASPPPSPRRALLHLGWLDCLSCMCLVGWWVWWQSHLATTTTTTTTSHFYNVRMYLFERERESINDAAADDDDVDDFSAVEEQKKRLPIEWCACSTLTHTVWELLLLLLLKENGTDVLLRVSTNLNFIDGEMTTRWKWTNLSTTTTTKFKSVYY